MSYKNFGVFFKDEVYQAIEDVMSGVNLLNFKLLLHDELSYMVILYFYLLRLHMVQRTPHEVDCAM